MVEALKKIKKVGKGQLLDNIDKVYTYLDWVMY